MVAFFAWLENSSLSVWVREAETIWAYATVLTLHTFGMTILVGASMVLDLRLIGAARRIDLASLRTLFRVMWIGLALNALTGSILFAADANAMGTSALFLVKLSFVAIGVAMIVLIKRRLYAAGAEPVTVNATTKRLAIASILIWVATITAGRLLPYVG